MTKVGENEHHSANETGTDEPGVVYGTTRRTVEQAVTELMQGIGPPHPEISQRELASIVRQAVAGACRQVEETARARAHATNAPVPPDEPTGSWRLPKLQPPIARPVAKPKSFRDRCTDALVVAVRRNPVIALLAVAVGGVVCVCAKVADADCVALGVGAIAACLGIACCALWRRPDGPHE
jgi:hypothetical protein